MQKASRRAGSCSSRECDGFENAAFFFLTVGVKLVEAAGDFAGAGGVFHAEEFDDVAGHIHAAGGVDARGDAKCDFAGRERTAADLRDLEQGFQSGIHR